MSVTLTAISGPYNVNGANGIKSRYFIASFTNPYTAGGESVTVSSYFNAAGACIGGRVVAIDPRVAIAAVGPMAAACIRGYSASVAAVKIQLLDVGLPGTANAGLLVDSTTANISGILSVWRFD